jgi:4-hydroxy-3-methylbut-2-enyl diphosphate reductase
VQELADVEQLDVQNPRVAVTCQTTLSLWDTEALIDAVRERFPEVEVHNEICRATQERQEAAVEAAKDVDLVVVVGSPRSSNSNRLVEVVRELGGKPAHLVDSLADIDLRWFDGLQRVGITSGASTPTRLTREVMQYLEALERQPDGSYRPPAATTT